ncbi:uncharacterized protein A1O9_02386 [Exophiala aquamarina CBS 119918]|uniref:Transcription factor domain-containing protein n=1 Tax=Exophiala aquamarina CBS 119918 TaxID=1182545 RepID=A0A072PL79_9EURO|nr:uncharacterized protein A1O9_02386 [Exophiala aquamarina CBS 119918]KEF60824.1 hypothetical protein A1O9_02386 [Exophiala aquamarina CBS 119918]
MSTSSSASPVKRSPPLEVVPSPSNDFTIFVGGVIDRVKFTLDSDLRYSLTWAFGGYLLEVPKRLGVNPALDAAASALVASHRRFNSGIKVASVDELTKYQYALSQLRSTLDDSALAASANTLCAVMLLMICQYFIGLIGNAFTSHSDGAAQILKAKGSRYNEADDFEAAMILSLRGPILFEGLFNRKIRFRNDEWDHLIKNRLENVTDVGKMLCCLARVPEIAERRHRALTNGEEYQFSDLRNESAEIYDVSVNISKNLQQLYMDAGSKATDSSGTKCRSVCSPRDWILYANYQRLYGLSLFTVCFLNCLLRSFTSSNETQAGLCVEVAYYTNEIITLAHESDAFRPLGSSYLILCLFIAWLSGPDNRTREQIIELWEGCCSDVPSIKPRIQELEATPFGYTIVDILDGISTKWAILSTEGADFEREPQSRDRPS